VARRWEFPASREHSGIRIAADAELLNRPELPRLLKRADFDSASLTPAELLARLYRELGVSFVERLDGVFSFALWDEENRRLVLAIDRLGVNSLYWRKEGDRILFASRVGAIRNTQEAPASINPARARAVPAVQRRPCPDGDLSGNRKTSPGTFPHIRRRSGSPDALLGSPLS